MTVPVPNARLLEVRSEALDPDADITAPGALKWSGLLPVRVSERTETDTAGGRLDVLRKTAVVVPSDIPELAAVTPGDYLVYLFRSDTPLTRKVVDVHTDGEPGMAWTALTLEDE